jgi:hypothetical protein
MESAQVRTKKRVSDHGEVLTGQREVNAMLDLVKQETEPTPGSSSPLAATGTS